MLAGYVGAIIGICHRLRTYNSYLTLLIHPVSIHDRYSYLNHEKIYSGFPVPTSAGLNLIGGITELIYPIVAGLILSPQPMYISALHQLLISSQPLIQYVNLFNNSSILGLGNTLVKRSAKLVSVSSLAIRVAPLAVDSLLML